MSLFKKAKSAAIAASNAATDVVSTGLEKATDGVKSGLEKATDTVDGVIDKFESKELQDAVKVVQEASIEGKRCICCGSTISDEEY